MNAIAAVKPNVTPSPQNPKRRQHQTAKETIATNVKALIEQLEEAQNTAAEPESELAQACKAQHFSGGWPKAARCGL